jgi:hypothetical protein
LENINIWFLLDINPKYAKWWKLKTYLSIYGRNQIVDENIAVKTSAIYHSETYGSWESGWKDISTNKWLKED